MFDFLKNVKNLSIVAVSSNFGWLIDNRNAIKNVEKIVVLTPPAIQRELKRNYKGSDVYFKYVDEMKEAAQICDCAMFININQAFIDEYMKYASHYGSLNFVVLPKGSGKMFRKVANTNIDGCEYEIFNIRESIETKSAEAIVIEPKVTIVEATVEMQGPPFGEPIIEKPKEVKSSIRKGRK